MPGRQLRWPLTLRPRLALALEMTACAPAQAACRVDIMRSFTSATAMSLMGQRRPSNSALTPTFVGCCSVVSTDRRNTLS